jgi:hypothetical protein
MDPFASADSYDSAWELAEVEKRLLEPTNWATRVYRNPSQYSSTLHPDTGKAVGDRPTLAELSENTMPESRDASQRRVMRDSGRVELPRTNPRQLTQGPFLPPPRCNDVRGTTTGNRIIPGPNRFGRNGTLRCEVCRRWKRRVLAVTLYN